MRDENDNKKPTFKECISVIKRLYRLEMNKPLPKHYEFKTTSGNRDTWCRSRTWKIVPASTFFSARILGRSRFSGFSISLTVDQIVVSVGPYIFHSELHLVSRLCARSADKASPPHNTFRFNGISHPEIAKLIRVR